MGPEEIARLKKAIFEIYAKHTGQSLESVKKAHGTGTVHTPEEGVALGLLDTVIAALSGPVGGQLPFVPLRTPEFGGTRGASPGDLGANRRSVSTRVWSGVAACRLRSMARRRGPTGSGRGDIRPMNLNLKRASRLLAPALVVLAAGSTRRRTRSARSVRGVTT